MATTDLALTIAVLTYHRPKDLAAIMPYLTQQANRIAGQVARVRVLIVDNSPTGDARESVGAYAATQPPGLVAYEHEPRPGIASARNRSLDASTDFDVLAFIDDDERPTEGWLQLLLTTFIEHQAVAAVGSVVSEYEVPPSDWIEAGRFFHRKRRPTGSPVSIAATNNLLIDLRVVRKHGLRFNEAMGMDGGEDTLFTRQLARHGLMVWCDEATVIDVVPRNRITREWVVRRALSSGNSHAVTSVLLADSTPERIQARLTSAAQGLVRVAGGAGRVAVGAVGRRMDHRARGVRTMARGAGMVLGAIGVSYLEYARPGRRRIEIARR